MSHVGSRIANQPLSQLSSVELIESAVRFCTLLLAAVGLMWTWYCVRSWHQCLIPGQLSSPKAKAPFSTPWFTRLAPSPKSIAFCRDWQQLPNWGSQAAGEWEAATHQGSGILLDRKPLEAALGHPPAASNSRSGDGIAHGMICETEYPFKSS